MDEVAKSDYSTDAEDVTHLLRIWRESNHTELHETLYAELRRLASVRMLGENHSPTFSGSDLVSEVILKLIRTPGLFQDRHHFYAVVLRAMKQCLIDRARTKGRLKRKGVRVELDDAMRDSEAENFNTELCHALNEVVAKLRTYSDRAAVVFERKYYLKMDNEACAASMGLSVAVVRKEHTKAVAFIREMLTR